MRGFWVVVTALLFIAVLLAPGAGNALAQERGVPYKDTIRIRQNSVQSEIQQPEIPDTSRWDEAIMNPGIFLQMLSRNDGVDENMRMGIGVKLRIPMHRFESQGCLYLEPSVCIGAPYVFYDMSIGVAPYRWAYLFAGYGFYSRTDDKVSGYLDLNYRSQGAVIAGAGVRMRYAFCELKYLIYTSDWKTDIISHSFQEQTTMSQHVPNSVIINIGVII